MLWPARQCERCARSCLLASVARVVSLGDQIDRFIIPDRLVAAVSCLFGVLGGC